MEERVFTRVDFSEWATISYEDQVFGGLVINISLMGLFVQMHQELPLNTPVEVRIHHCIDKSLNLKAVAVRYEKSGLGMKINKMDIDSVLYLRKLIEENSKDPELVVIETKKMVDSMLA